MESYKLTAALLHPVLDSRTSLSEVYEMIRSQESEQGLSSLSEVYQ